MNARFMNAAKTLLTPLFAAFFLSSVPAAFAEPNHAETLEMARAADPESYDYAMRQGAEVVSTEDGRSFLLWWQPLGFDFKNDPVLVTMGGTRSWATKDFAVWHPRVEGRGWAILDVQWWYGRSDDTPGYARPKDIYPWIEAELERRGIPRGHAIFHGFSRGSANSYAVTFIDRKRKDPYFALTISNSGPLEPGYPPNKAFLQSDAGERPFEGSRWILYCSERDAERPGSCEKTEATKNLLEGRGAKVDLFIRDAEGGHGGFMDPRTNGPALDAAQRIFDETER